MMLGGRKKGSGRSYNSLTGHGTMIGHESGKVIGYATRGKRCVKCLRGHDKDDHNCRANSERSSKAMEPDMAVQIITGNKSLEEENVQITTLVGDDDSSTIVAVRRSATHQVLKWTDKNHATTNLTKTLYALKNVHGDVIKYLKYCFSCVLETNKNQVEATEAALLNIVPHAFDEHNNCGDWCKFRQDPENYKHKILPKGQGLRGDDLKATLTAVFQKFARNAEKLSPCGSSQPNESLNMVIASKAPKARHYGGSESNDYRVAAGVLQKNLGTKYVGRVYQKLGYSPGEEGMKYREKKDFQRMVKSAKAKTVEFKKRRRALFTQRHKKTTAAETREGITYQSGCGLDATVDFVDDPVPLPPEVAVGTQLVFFDLETTGLTKESEIVQIAAKCQNLEYSAYIVPSRGIPPAAAAITGLEVTEGEMFLNGDQVTTVPRRAVMEGFISFLCSFGPVVLVAHNCHAFDAVHLVREVQSLEMWDPFISVVHGFADTLPVFRAHLPERIKGKKSFKQAVLATEFLGPDAAKDAHNAVSDVQVLEQLVTHFNIDAAVLTAKALAPLHIVQRVQKGARNKLNKTTLDCLKDGVSDGMRTKIAAAGLNLGHLKDAFAKGGKDCVTFLLAEDVGGKPRITKNKKVIDGLMKVLETLPK